MAVSPNSRTKSQFQNDHPCTPPEAAEVNFEPWQHHPDEWRPPTNDEWARLANPHLIMLRIAWTVLHKTKPELVAIAQEMNDSATDQTEITTGEALEFDLDRSQIFFRDILTFIETAEARILCARLSGKVLQ